MESIDRPIPSLGHCQTLNWCASFNGLFILRVGRIISVSAVLCQNYAGTAVSSLPGLPSQPKMIAEFGITNWSLMPTTSGSFQVADWFVYACITSDILRERAPLFRLHILFWKVMGWTQQMWERYTLACNSLLLAMVVPGFEVLAFYNGFSALFSQSPPCMGVCLLILAVLMKSNHKCPDQAFGRMSLACVFCHADAKWLSPHLCQVFCAPSRELEGQRLEANCGNLVGRSLSTDGSGLWSNSRASWWWLHA